MGRKKLSLEKKTAAASLLAVGMDPEDVADELDISVHAVCHVEEKVSAGIPLGNRPGQGRPRLTTAMEDRQLLRLAKKDRTASRRQLAGEWSTQLEQINPRQHRQPSKTTITRRLLGCLGLQLVQTFLL